jgi:hypothetical protein
MSTNRPEVIAEANLSHAWGKAFLRMMGPNSVHAPITLSVETFTNRGLPIEDPAIREATDAALKNHGLLPIANTAYTIFPNDSWEFQKQPPHEKFAPAFKKWVFPFMYRSHRGNRTGTYFQRIVAFGAEIDKQGHLSPEHVDQPAKILAFWRGAGSHRRSALQMACFDPNRDHHGKARSGFPCLQQVSLSYDSQHDGLAITGYYPSEFIFDRGYGNYLGLCHLGRYMAKNMGLHLIRMNCVIAHPLLGGEGVSKTPLRPLEKLIRKQIDDANAAAAST